MQHYVIRNLRTGVDVEVDVGDGHANRHAEVTSEALRAGRHASDPALQRAFSADPGAYVFLIHEQPRDRCKLATALARRHEKDFKDLAGGG